jgi:putative PEP-CTERM system histidine kinase
VTAAVSALLYGGSAAICLAWTVLVVAAGRGPTAWLLGAATGTAGLWAGAVALTPETPLEGLAGGLEIARSGVWFLLLLRLHARIVGGRASPLLRRFGLAGAVLGLLALACLLPRAAEVLVQFNLGSPALLARLGLALLVVLLAENLYRNADETQRWHVNLPCIALGGLAAFDVLVFADAALSRAFSDGLLDARAVLTALSAPLLAVAAVRDGRWRRAMPVSRQAVFHGATLVVAGAFLLGVGAVGEALRHFGADWGQAAQASLLAAAVMALAVAATSRTARSRMRHLIVDHFFTARYDYRREWLRCVDVLSGPVEAEPAERRAIRAVADAADSPAGALMMRDPAAASLRWAGSWNMPSATHALPLGAPMLAQLAAGEVVVFGADQPVPAEIAALGRLWLAIPLLHHREGLVGVVALAPPRAAFTLDREVFELLRTLGREVAMFLAERQAAERLAEQHQLQDYARRFAFVAHDVKTVSSQLTLLLANAEDNIQDPEFQHDMLLTVRASASRINTLIARLRQPEAELGPVTAAPTSDAAVAPLERLRAIAAATRHPVRIEALGAPVGLAAIPREPFDAAVGHLVNNAAEASPPGVPVNIVLRGEPGRMVVEIADAGRGMTPEFIRDELFRPLSSSKPGGSGIGAWQARELLRQAGGDLIVESRPDAGTTMRLILPAQEARQGAVAQEDAA